MAACPFCAQCEGSSLLGATEDLSWADERSLWSPTVEELESSENAMDHFRWHWERGEPVIVRGGKKVTGEDWSPDGLSKQVGNQTTIAVLDSNTGKTVDMEVKTFFDILAGRKNTHDAGLSKDSLLKVRTARY